MINKEFCLSNDIIESQYIIGKLPEFIHVDDVQKFIKKLKEYIKNKSLNRVKAIKFINKLVGDKLK